MVSPSLVAAVITLLPAMGLLYLYLRRYEGYFEQNRLFFALLVGLFAGTIVRALEVFLFPFDNPGLLQGTNPPFTRGTLVYSFAYTVVGFAFMETLGKTAVLGAKKFRTRKDTPYYGAALGIGFGAMWTTQIVAANLVRDTTGAASFATPHLIWGGFLWVFALGILLAHAASAVWIGKGAGEGKLWQGVLFGTLWLAPALVAHWLLQNYPVPTGLVALGSLAWGIAAMWVADRRILVKIVPPHIREMVRKQQRRNARRQAREGDSMTTQEDPAAPEAGNSTERKSA